jgi:prephenate dehydrogenase
MSPESLSSTRIAILGLGLIGGSLALALRGKCAALLGIDPDPQTLELARQRQVVDAASNDPAELLPAADLVILAAPVRAILALLADLPAWHPGSPVVIDIGSTKSAIVAAMQALPERFDPLGGHPMCGKEKPGLQHAEAAIFQGAPFALTPLPRTSPSASALALELLQAIGARPLLIDHETHDQWVASTSHLPYLVSNALAFVTPLEAAPLVGSGFRSTTRLAPSSLPMMLDILATNRQHLLTALHNLQSHLSALETLLQSSDEPALHAALTSGAAHYHHLTAVPNQQSTI